MVKQAKKPAKKAASKKPATNKPPTLAQKNAATLKKFNQGRSSLDDQRFTTLLNHAAKKEGDACAVLGTVNGVEYSQGFTDAAEAKQIVLDLNKLYFK